MIETTASKCIIDATTSHYMIDTTKSQCIINSTDFLPDDTIFIDQPPNQNRLKNFSFINDKQTIIQSEINAIDYQDRLRIQKIPKHIVI